MEGLDYSALLLKPLEKLLNNKGIVVLEARQEIQGQSVRVQGLGNKKIHSIIIEKMETQPNDEEAAALVSNYLNSIESGLRTAPMPSEETE